MGTNHKASRTGRVHRRPDVECLEVRQLLSGADPSPAAATGSAVRADGTVAYDQVIGASAARAAYGVDGAGGNVAVIDTGVDYRNPAFGSGGVGSAANKVVAGVDFTGSPNGVLPTWQHGTGVAGLIASTDAANTGVAPGSGIVALRVFGDNNKGSFGNIAAALDWVIQNHGRYAITAVNLSVSDGGNYLSNTFGDDMGDGQAITADVQALAALNIPVVVAAGNAFDGRTQGMGFASIIPGTISVTATDETKGAGGKGDVLAGDAQRLGPAKGGASATDLAAPGVALVAPSGASGTAIEEGTSFAAPQVTGTILLLQQMYRRTFGSLPTVDQLDGWLKAGADAIRDAATGIDLGRLDVAGALGALSGQIQAVAAANAANAPPAVVAAPAVVATPVDVPIAATPTPTPTPTPPADPTPPPATAPTDAAPTPPPAPPQAPPAEPTTEVIINGVSQGTVKTSQLSGTYARLFALTGGSASTLRAWTAPGSTIDLGAAKASGKVARVHAAVLKVGTPTPRAATPRIAPARAARRAR